MSLISDNYVRRAKRTGKFSNTPHHDGPDAATKVAPDVALRSLLDQVHEVLASPAAEAAEIENAVDQLFHGLRSIRQQTPKAQWHEMIKEGRQHPLKDLLHQDPFTARAFNKPRGYAGDAVMMDYIYSREESWPNPPASAVGAAVFNYTTAAPASAGVRERRCYIAELLDAMARQHEGQDVLAVAAGHLREASLSTGVRRQRFARFVAMDADEKSLEEIERCYGRYGIDAVTANIRQMLSGNLDLGSFDLIYSTGLYDYLADSTAMRLTANLFECLRPGGKLVIANFLPEIRDIGYMEMFMDWHLIYRTRGQMMQLADRIVQSNLEEIRIVAEDNE
ncbi:MAG: class I SAM-dependent methyltransferase, partial [Novipirellula sp. JB048]